LCGIGRSIDLEALVAEDVEVTPRLRDWAMRTVRWEPARDAVKVAARQVARARGFALVRTNRVPDIATIFLASSPKAGSQWAKAVFDHPVVRQKTGLFTLPQLDYQALKPRRFPAGTLVPGLYVSYPHYLKIPKRFSYRTIYIFRDPRELVVSAYFSATETHRIIGKLGDVRQQLQSLPIDEGLLQMIRLLGFRLEEMATWAGVDDPSVLFCRLEEIGADPRDNVARMLKHCGVTVSADEFETVLADTSRESLQRKDLSGRTPGSESHYRVQRRSYQDLFTAEHYQAIEDIVPGLVQRLNYPPPPS
jgi:hypothetical protein